MTKHLAKKKFGQNFLKDESVLEEIIEAIPNTSNRILEIGTGLGDLTKKLVLIRNVTSFEIDLDLKKHLDKVFSKDITNKNLEIIYKDVLDIKGNFLETKYDLVANLPYYISVNILLKALRDCNCENILVSIQKEVAEKICASVDNRNFSSLCVIVKSLGYAKLLRQIAPSSFLPVPKVDSALVLIKKNKKSLSKDFEDFLKIAFKQIRKTLFKNLSLHFSKDELKEIFAKLELKENIRPHQIDFLYYHHIFKLLYKREVYERN